MRKFYWAKRCSMALNMHNKISFYASGTVVPKICFFYQAKTTCHLAAKAPGCDARVAVPCDQMAIARRSGNYRPSIWEFEYIQLLHTEYGEEIFKTRASDMKVKVKMMLEQAKEPLDQLELIEHLQRLGISYHFEAEINQILTDIYRIYSERREPKMKDLYATALGFRLLRQHGFDISPGVLDYFKNEKGDFMSSSHHDTRGLLQLYEASYLSVDGEETLEMARKFSMKALQETMQDCDENLALVVYHALDVPAHWTVSRPEARWFIDIYGRRPDMNPLLLKFAKLDFNIVLATHQEELKNASRWWKGTHLAEKLPFARDRLVECFFWTIGGSFEPQHEFYRRIMTKVNVFITTIDDIYDVYGTLEELEVFTSGVERWDVNTIEQLPDYMRICYLALFNFVNEMAYDVLKEKGFLIIPYLRKAWTDLCKAYLKEAKWYQDGYTPTLEEYMENAWLSVGTCVLLSHSFFCVTDYPIENEALQCIQSYHDLIRCSGTIVRLADDLGTSTEELKRGDVPKALQCYMNETGASEEEARQYVKILIHEMWKKLNQYQCHNSPFSPNFVDVVVNLARMAQLMYRHGDGHGTHSNILVKDLISASLFEPITLTI